MLVVVLSDCYEPYLHSKVQCSVCQEEAGTDEGVLLGARQHRVFLGVRYQSAQVLKAFSVSSRHSSLFPHWASFAVCGIHLMVCNTKYSHYDSAQICIPLLMLA